MRKEHKIYLFAIVIAVGEAYESKSGCKNGIESIKRNAPHAELVDTTE